METANELESAIKSFRESNHKLIEQLWTEDAKAARLYYQSTARVTDEAKVNAVRAVAEQIDRHLKDKTVPSATQMCCWSEILWRT